MTPSSTVSWINLEIQASIGIASSLGKSIAYSVAAMEETMTTGTCFRSGSEPSSLLTSRPSRSMRIMTSGKTRSGVSWRMIFKAIWPLAA